jgi:lysophospholipase L1-like esterase
VERGRAGLAGCRGWAPAAAGKAQALPRILLKSRRLLVALALAASLLFAAACTESPADEAPSAYVALGDSYSSGVGAERYISGSGACLRSKQSYVFALGRTVSSFRACAGATTGTVLAGQLRAFPANTRLVTISIGGNDAGFVDVVTTCLLGKTESCSARVAKSERFVRQTLPARLDRVYDAIRRRAPQATVLVVGYPRLFAGRPWCGSVGEIDEREQRRLNEASNALARTTAAEVRRHDGFRFVDVRTAFNGGGVCSPSPRINGVADPVSDSFHPNVAGYRTYARVIKARL